MKFIALAISLFLTTAAFALDCEDQMSATGAKDPIEAVREFAIKAHGNQMYGDRPYVEHLDEVAAVLRRFGYNDMKNPLHVIILKSAYLHDVIEDSKLGTREELKKMAEDVAGFPAADAAYRVTDADMPHADRKTRKLATYPKIKGHVLATILKLADRIANLESSLRNSLQWSMRTYTSEHPGFREHVFVAGIAEPMWTHLENLINEANRLLSESSGTN